MLYFDIKLKIIYAISNSNKNYKSINKANKQICNTFIKSVKDLKTCKV